MVQKIYRDLSALGIQEAECDKIGLYRGGSVKMPCH